MGDDTCIKKVPLLSVAAMTYRVIRLSWDADKSKPIKGASDSVDANASFGAEGMGADSAP